MSNTTYATGAGTKFAEFIDDMRSSLSDYRNDYLDLREAAITTKRLKYAVNNLTEGNLYEDEAEELIKKADEAIGSYNYSNDTSDSWKVIPESMRWFMVGALIILELIVAFTAINALWSLPWVVSDALVYTLSIVAFLIVAVAMDLLAFYAVAKISVFFIEMRIARVEGYQNVLKNFVEK